MAARGVVNLERMEKETMGAAKRWRRA